MAPCGIAIITTVAFFVFAPIAAEGLDPSRRITQYIHQSWQVEDGLPQNSAQSIAQTHDGYLWFGTEEGVARFDGVRFVVFDTYNTPGLRHNWISDFEEDRSGALWISTYGGGVTIYRNGKFEPFRKGEIFERVWPLHEDRQGAMWIGTFGGGIYRAKGKDLTHYTVQNGLSSNSVTSIGEDSEGAIWIGTSKGLNRFLNGKITQFPFERILSLFEDSRRNLWIGTTRGLIRYTQGAFRTFTTDDGLPDNAISAIHEDRDGNLWLGTDGGGLVRWKEGATETFSTRNGLTSDHVWSLMEDREGNLWVGTAGGGVNMFRTGKFLTYTTAEGMTNQHAWSVIQDRAGATWVGTNEGVLRLHPDGHFESFANTPGFPKGQVCSIYEDRAGTIWIGTYGEGLFEFRNGKMRHYTHDDGLAENYVWAILEDRDSGLWIGTGGGGLNFLKDGKFAVYNSSQGIGSNNVHALAQDPDGTVWIGTEGGGLSRMKEGKITTYSLKAGLSNDQILCMYRDSRGILWIGTRGGGLNRFENGRFRAIRKENGLYDGMIQQIVEDRDGKFWMTSNRGLFSIRRKDAEDFLSGKIPVVRSTAYGLADGMRTTECNGGYQPGATRDQMGRIWIPTIRGLVVADPRRLSGNSVPPPVRIESFLANKKPVPFGAKEIRLAPGSGNLEFQYTALSFVAPEKVLFRYRLEGFDRDWIDAGTRRTAYFTNLPAGHYRFRVMGLNNDGVRSAKEASLQFYVEPHFYQTSWFLLICAGAAFFAASGAHRLRLRRIKAEFAAVLAERNRIAREIHDTLAQGLTGIVLQLDAADSMTEVERSKYHILRARGMAHESLLEARRTVQALRPLALERMDFPSAVSDAMQQITSDTPMRSEILVEGTPRKMRPVVEENLLRIVQETVTNSVKHSAAEQISIRLSYESRVLTITVSDNGTGFDVSKASPAGHFGLQGIHERIHQLRGELKITSEPEHGTTTWMRIPL